MTQGTKMAVTVRSESSLAVEQAVKVVIDGVGVRGVGEDTDDVSASFNLDCVHRNGQSAAEDWRLPSWSP